MTGWRARLGFLLPPGNPTIEPEMMALVPPGVSLRLTPKPSGCLALVRGARSGFAGLLA